MSRIYVVGHKNPDNDAIMSAVTYANLMNARADGNDYVAVRLGPLPTESSLVLSEYGVAEPELIESVGDGDKVILTDHNELGQAVDGLADAEVVGIVDHHRIADVTTASPIPFINLPWGSTCSIVTRLYAATGIERSDAMAACLLSAILTDTVILKSPTATDVDAKLVGELSSQLGVDATEFGMRLFKSRGGDDDVEVGDMCTRDSKEFNFGGKKVWVAQYETVDLEGLRGREGEVAGEVSRIQQAGGYDAALMLLTDIIAEGSDFIAAGDVAFIEDAFSISFADGPVWMPGVMSRKKQVAAPLIDYTS